MKDNTYHLHRHLWNDVSEDWQFYSEQVHMHQKSFAVKNITSFICHSCARLCWFYFDGSEGLIGQQQLSRNQAHKWQMSDVAQRRRAR